MIINGDSNIELKKLDDNSVDAVVTDPPYGLSFMGKQWDYDVPSVEIWKECLRVLKPGGYLLSFAGTRTQHRMAVNIEDAGFEIRDMIAWVYGSGFPKSHNIGKAVDKLQGNEREDLGHNPNGRPNQAGEQLNTYGKRTDNFSTKGNSPYEGWGTALKPALEPITVARKPLEEKTVAKNVLKYGTGGINIDGGRIDSKPRKTGTKATSEYDTENQGRFPANLILDEEAGKMLDEQSGVSKSNNAVRKNKVSTGENNIYHKYEPQDSFGYNDKGGASRFFYCAKASKAERNEGCEGLEEKQKIYNGQSNNHSKDMKGVEKKFTTQPTKNNHPTVKPIKLMQYLVRLVTPKGGIVLDPFMGSGTTGIACKKEGFKFIGIDNEEDYCEIAKARIKAVKDKLV